jgi:hypothetical protein
MVEVSDDAVVIDETESGTLYIKGERDHVRGEVSPYYKVGIVRGKREVTARDKALKTGNPRTITNLFEIESPFVQRLETRLHNEYAFARVSSGEWIDSGRFSVDAMTAAATELGQELAAAAPSLVRSAQIAGPGAGPVEAPSQRILELHADFTRASLEKSVLAKHRSALNAELGRRAEADRDLYGLYFKETRTEDKPSFSTVKFKKEHPDLHREFSRKGEGKHSYKITLGEQSVDLDDILSAVVPVEELGDVSVAPQLLHRQSLELWGLIAKRDWVLAVLEAHILCEAQDLEGIQDVLTWSYLERSSFDREAFAAKYPEIVAEFTFSTPGKTAYSVAEWAAYGTLG